MNALINRTNVNKILELVDAGLTAGLGKPEPGKMCVEAAVCSVLYGRHADDPECVGFAVRGFKIALNDQPWESNDARAKGMRRLAIAQLGSNEIDQVEFAKALALGTVTEILPLILPPGKERDACMKAETLDEAHAYAASAAAIAAYAAANAAYAAANAAAYVAYAADDSIRRAAAELAVQILISMNCPGTKFLEEVA